MAINPELDSSGALALTPGRVNIFAKPEDAAAERPSRPQPKTIFDPAAACQPGEGDDRHHATASQLGQRTTARSGRGGIARVVGVSGLALVIALLALRPAGPAMSDRSRPGARQHETTLRARGEQTRHARAQDALRRPRTRKRAKPHRTKPHRAPRHHRRPARVPPRPTQRPAPVRPIPAPSLPAPRQATPAQPLPMRVPRSAPPEFM